MRRARPDIHGTGTGEAASISEILARLPPARFPRPTTGSAASSPRPMTRGGPAAFTGKEDRGPGSVTVCVQVASGMDGTMTEKLAKRNVVLSDKSIETPRRQEKFYSIQALRAIAALAVVLFHDNILRMGYSGVDIFFVISGFIMGTIGIDERPVDFLIKRFIRVVPLYWIVTAVACIVSLVPGVVSKFSFDTAAVIKSLLFIPYLDYAGRVWPIVIAGWTLNYEMFFYLVFALGLAVARPRLLPPVLMIGLVAIGLLLKPEDPGPQTYTDPLLLEFIAGLALSQTIFPRGYRLGLGLFLAGAALFVLVNVTGVPEGRIAHLVCLGIPALALVAGALALERAGGWPRLKPLEVVGDASYSLYLLHGLIIVSAQKFLPLPPIPHHVSVLGISILVAVLSHRLFELPMARLLRRSPHRSPPSGLLSRRRA